MAAKEIYEFSELNDAKLTLQMGNAFYFYYCEYDRMFPELERKAAEILITQSSYEFFYISLHKKHPDLIIRIRFYF